MKHIFYTNKYLFYGTFPKILDFILNSKQFKDPLVFWQSLSFINLEEYKLNIQSIVTTLKIINLLNFGNTPYNSQQEIFYLKKIFSEPIINSYISTPTSNSMH